MKRTFEVKVNTLGISLLRGRMRISYGKKGCQLDVKWMSIGCQMDVKWMSIGRQLCKRIGHSWGAERRGAARLLRACAPARVRACPRALPTRTPTCKDGRSLP